jgi:hypothetical protein
MASWRDIEESQGVETRGPTLQVQRPEIQVQSTVDDFYEEMQSESEGSGISEEVRQLTEARRRLSKANYYETIIGTPFFEGNASEIALEVEQEFQDFALKQLQKLMGHGVEEELAKLSPQFNAEEELALKAWAAKILGKPPSAPTQLSMDTSPAKKSATVLKAPVAPPKPKLRKRVDTQLPPEPAPEVVQKPQAPTQQAPKRRTSRPAPAPGSGTPPTTAAAKVAEVPVTGPNGETQVVKMDLRQQVQPTGPIKPLPPPNPDLLYAQELNKAMQSEGSHAVLSQFLKLNGE